MIVSFPVLPTAVMKLIWLSVRLVADVRSTIRWLSFAFNVAVPPVVIFSVVVPLAVPLTNAPANAVVLSMNARPPLPLTVSPALPSPAQPNGVGPAIDHIAIRRAVDGDGLGVMIQRVGRPRRDIDRLVGIERLDRIWRLSNGQAIAAAA